MQKYLEKLKEFFATTARLPGVGLYIGCGRYQGFTPSCSRYGLVINFGFVWFMFITYDFVASSQEVMNELMDKRREIQTLNMIYSSKPQRKIRGMAR
jgi:hypothetical protein